MKEKIVMLVIGIVIGVVLAGGCFWFATSVTKSNTGGDKAPFSENMLNRAGMRPDKSMDSNSTAAGNEI